MNEMLLSILPLREGGSIANEARGSSLVCTWKWNADMATCWTAFQRLWHRKKRQPISRECNLVTRCFRCLSLDHGPLTVWQLQSTVVPWSAPIVIPNQIDTEFSRVRRRVDAQTDAAREQQTNKLCVGVRSLHQLLCNTTDMTAHL